MVFEDKCYLIAEIGVNHGGDMELARKMIVAAKESGADAVKFQTFTAATLVTQGTPKVKYQESTTSPEESHFDMIRNLEFRREDHRPVMEYCDAVGVDFISTPYDIDSARFLDQLGVTRFKTASADIVDLPLHEFLAQTKKTVFIATGMATLGEVEDAVNIYRAAGNEDITLLHCVSNYPCSDESLNLRVISTLQNAFFTTVGFSDHSVGSQAAVISVALGARVIEKHFTLDKNLPGPDHKASSTPEEFKELVSSVRRAEKSLGSPIKRCQEEERQMAMVSRKSIVAARDIPAGKVIEESDLIMKRPGTGLPATEISNLVGRKTRENLQPDHVLSWSDLE